MNARGYALGGLFALFSASCVGGKTERRYVGATGGDPAAGARIIRQVGCGACHEIPGIRGAHGVVASPLTHFAERTFVAGELPNNVANLALWIRSPHSVEPNTAMPELGLDAREARDVAAYLYSRN